MKTLTILLVGCVTLVGCASTEYRPYYKQGVPQSISESVKANCKNAALDKLIAEGHGTDTFRDFEVSKATHKCMVKQGYNRI